MGCMQSCLSGGNSQRPATSSSSHHAPRPSHTYTHSHSYSEKPTAIDGRRPPTAPVPGTHRSWKAVEHDGGHSTGPQASDLTVVGSESDLGIKGKEEDVDDEERAKRAREARRKAEAEEQERRDFFQYL
jgi:hypothetical protein